MTKKLLIFSTLALTLLIAGSICVVWAVNVVFAIELAASFDTSKKFEIQTVGEFTNSETEASYLFVTKNSGISFPDGTIVDMYDDGWDTVNCCFTVPVSNYAALVASLAASRTDVHANDFRSPKLSQDNQVLPESASRLELNENSYNMSVYCDDSTNRIWLDYRYTSPFD